MQGCHPSNYATNYSKALLHPSAPARVVCAAKRAIAQGLQVTSRRLRRTQETGRYYRWAIHLPEQRCPPARPLQTPRPEDVTMRHGTVTAEDWFLLAAGSVGALCRWRVEMLALGAPLLAADAIEPAFGDLGAKVVVAAAVATLIVVPTSRVWLLRVQRSARLRRRWRRAWIACGLPKVRAGRITRVPAGEQMRVRVARGSSLGTTRPEPSATSSGRPPSFVTTDARPKDFASEPTPLWLACR